MSRSHVVVWVCSIVLLAGSASAGDWHQWRGPEQTGVSPEKGLPESWSAEGENLLWTNKVGGMSSPIVMNGRVYTITRVGEQTAPGTLVAGPKTQEAVVCVDAATGNTVWEYRENITQSEVPFHRLGWSNVVGDPATGRVYALLVHCSMVCLDGDTGKLVWKRQMTEEFGMISTFGGRTPSPALDEDQVIVAGVAFGWGDNAQGQHRLFALDKNTGELNWTGGTGGRPVDAPYNTPVVAVIAGQRLAIFAAGDGGVHAFKVRTGERVWSHQVSKRGLNASVVVAGARVYACHSEENPEGSTMGAVVCIDAADGTSKELWRRDGIEAGFASPTIVDGRLYVIDNKASVFALDAMTGRQYWRKSAGTIGKASLVWADGKLYIGEANGRFVILKPGEKKADILSKVDLPDKMGREYSIFGSVAISNGRIFLQTANNMYCIGKETTQAASDPIAARAEEESIDPANPPRASFIQVRPADIVLRPGRTARFTAWAFDAQGRALGQVNPQWSIDQVSIPAPPSAAAGTPPTKAGNLKGDISEAGVFTASSAGHQGGAVVASVNGITGQARVRVLPAQPWKFDFEQAAIGRPPLTWLGAGGKFAVHDDNGNKVLAKLNDLDLYYRARTNFGAEYMTNYTLQADVKVGSNVVSGERHMPDPGIINSRYVLVLLGNHQRLQIHAWPSALPESLNRTIDYKWEPGVWYTMKLRVEQAADKAVVRGKVWAKGQAEPEAWTVELEDPLPNRNGNPGLFGHSLVTPYKSAIYYDNIEVTENK